MNGGDSVMPEEINRMATDALTDYFFTTSETANANLRVGFPQGVADSDPTAFFTFYSGRLRRTALAHRSPPLLDAISRRQPDPQPIEGMRRNRRGDVVDRLIASRDVLEACNGGPTPSLQLGPPFQRVVPGLS